MTAMAGSEDSELELWELGVDEVEPGICADTLANRRALRHAGYAFTQVVREDDNGVSATAWLEVISGNEAQRRQREWRERRTECLVDEENLWSEYQPPHELLADAPVPNWVRQSGIAWDAQIREGHNPELSGMWLPVRCQHVKRDGSRCWAWAGSSQASHAAGMCRSHLTVPMIVQRESFIKQVRDKLAQSSLVAVDRLEALLDAEAESVRLRAAAEILDRVGVRAGTEVSGEITVNHVDATALVRERLEKLREARAYQESVVVVGEVEP